MRLNNKGRGKVEELKEIKSCCSFCSMKCKCGHSFCWQCMKPWKPTHTDYYNCTAKISKAAADHRKFTDYNQRCTAHHKSKVTPSERVLCESLLLPTE